MQYQQSHDHYICRVLAGEELHAALLRFATQMDIPGAFITGLGAARSATIGMYHMDRHEYEYRSLTTPHEITNITGNIALDASGDTALHMHATLADSEQNALSGHLKEAVIEPTCELMITPCGTLHRAHDPHSQLPLFTLDTSL